MKPKTNLRKRKLNDSSSKKFAKRPDLKDKTAAVNLPPGVNMPEPDVHQTNQNSVENRVPLKSANDKREYRVICLENGLKALLISDPTPASDGDDEEEDDEEDEEDEDDEDDGSDGSESEEQDDDVDELEDDEDAKNKSSDASLRRGEKMAAAGLCIGVGSFSDPDDIPGLAHFLEHMVFMGSKKYPVENAFDAYIKKHSGSDNAVTDCERTVFHFDVHSKHFRQALDRFAQFFICPLLKADSMEREIESVDSEFQMSLPSDMYRKQQLFGGFAKDGHPMKKFMWGNTATLKARLEEQNMDIHARLKQFWQRHYSAQYMTLVVQSRESLDTLQTWVQEIFSQVPNNGLPLPTFNHLSNPFATEAFHKLYKVIPVNNIHQVEVTWALPCLMEHYRIKPLHYLSWLLGHEGKGSILSYLKKKIWALSLNSGNTETGFEHNSTYASFSIAIGLTEEGLAHLFEVITTIFQYIEMLRQSGPQERIYREIQTIEENEFRWEEESNPADYVQDLCENMQLFPPEDYIVGDQLLFDFNGKVISNVQNMLTPDRCNIVVMSQLFEKEAGTKKYEPWYQTPYFENEINPDWIEAWKDLKDNPALHLPEVNKFIANDFEIKPADIPQTSLPVKILDNTQSRLWYKKDNKFNVPRAHAYFRLITPIINSTPQSAVLLDLFVNSLNLNLSEAVYPSNVAQLSYSVFGDDTSLIIQVYGFNQNLSMLFETILDSIRDFSVEEDLFIAVKNQLFKAYYNNFIKPSRLCTDVRLSILQQVHWTPIDRRAILAGITSDMLITFVKELKRHLYVEGLVQGNLTSKEALQMDDMIRKKLRCCEVPPNMLPERRVMQLEPGERYCRVASFNMEDGNSVVTNYYQSGPGDIHKCCLMELLVTLMEEPCFDVLRTQQQLGYSVYCMFRWTFGILGFSVTVHTQADKFSCTLVDERIESFLASFLSKLEKNISDKEFQTQITSLVRLKRCVDLHLQEEVGRHWAEIITRNYLFDRVQKEIEHLGRITLPELREWYKEHIRNGSKFRKLGIQVVGSGRMQDGMAGRLAHKRRSSPRNCTHSEKPSRGHSPRSEVDRILLKQPSKECDGRTAHLSPGSKDDEECSKTPFKLHFLPTPTEGSTNNNNDDNAATTVFIGDIRSFKQGLMIYPVNKILQ